MKSLFLGLLLWVFLPPAPAQTTKVELADLLHQLITDSTGYENVGDWAVGKPRKYKVKWRADKIEMSNDTSINFYRQGTADITLNEKNFRHAGAPVQWNVLLKGPRMGYGSFSILSSGSAELPTSLTIDSIMRKRPYKARLLKSCTTKPFTGFHYYEVKLPKKDVAYVKLSWLTLNGRTALRIDSYDSYSSYAAKLDCPK